MTNFAASANSSKFSKIPASRACSWSAQAALAALCALTLLLLGCSGSQDTSPPEEEDYRFKGFRAEGSTAATAPRYLSEEVRQQIEASKRPWQSIVLHSSGGRGETFSALERHHEKVLALPDGLAYHYLIGDGTAEKAGAIFVSERWKQELDGAVLRAALDQGRIHICLLGRRQDSAPAEQLAALDELLALLQPRYGAKIFAHDQLEETVPKGCPGKRLSSQHWQQLQQLYPQAVTLPAKVAQ